MGLKEIHEELENKRDDLLDEVIEYFVTQPKQMNVSNIQRYFKVGYFRANRIIRQIEHNMKYYYKLEEGEIIRKGDEVEISANYNDNAKWVVGNPKNIGSKAPNPNFISHRKYRRPLTLENYWAANSSHERQRIVKKVFDLLNANSV